MALILHSPSASTVPVTMAHLCLLSQTLCPSHAPSVASVCPSYKYGIISPILGKKNASFTAWAHPSVAPFLHLSFSREYFVLCPKVLISYSLSNQLQAASVSTTSLNCSWGGHEYKGWFQSSSSSVLQGNWAQTVTHASSNTCCVRGTFSPFFPSSTPTPESPRLYAHPDAESQTQLFSRVQSSKIVLLCLLSLVSMGWWL